ncbi:MAG: hypothetical protein JRI72_00235 [Deltaproteobacteria bacterium]|nr:hypothetical protein [Deltaproteobacteria bacterium]
MTGLEFLKKYGCNPNRIKTPDGYVYTESDLVGMDSDDYQEVMEFGEVEE